MRWARLSSVALALALVTPALSGAAEPDAPPAATFALILGVNRSVDPELPVLRYADDDGARYHDLLRALGARTYLVTRPDENTRRLHAQAAAEAVDPVGASYDRVLAQVVADIEEARARKIPTVFYFIYAGHGNVRDGEGYLALEDRRLAAKDLADGVVARVRADRIHFIVDACYSFFLAQGRGPGGERRVLHGFAGVPELSQDDRVGLLLSTSAASQSHEWEGFQAGVFSHEVRSGLYGAADADGDGRVSYREIGAFVERANAAIPNERFRPNVFAQPPRGEEQLLDLRRGLQRHLKVDGTQSARYVLEDGLGVRLADLHPAVGEEVRLLRPPSAGLMFLRQLDGAAEFEIVSEAAVVRLSELPPVAPRAHPRGAAHAAFERAFSLPFARSDVLAFQFRAASELRSAEREASLRRWAGWISIGGAALAGGGATWAALQARNVERTTRPDLSNAEAAVRNDQIHRLNTGATALFIVGGAAAIAGTTLLLWPDSGTGWAFVPGTDNATFVVSGSF